MRLIAIDLVACKEAGLSVEEWCILTLLHHECSCKRTDVAAALGMHRASLWRRLRNLEERGFVHKDGDSYRVSEKFERYSCQEGESAQSLPQERRQKADKFGELLSELRKHVEVGEKVAPILKDFYDYRRSVKKPINTYRPLLSYLKSLKEIKEAGYDVQQAIELMKEREWQTLTLEYVEKTLPKQQPKFRW